MSIDFEGLQKSVLTEINRVRQDPMSYIPIIREQMGFLKGDVLYRPREVPIQTNEGAAAYEEAISFLKRQKPVDALTFDERISKACEHHVRDLGPRGFLSHDSTDGKSMSDRLELYVEWDKHCGESIDLGAKTGQEVLVNLLVDDGVPGKGDRLNIFKEEFKYVGVASGTHREYETMTVIDFTGGLREKGKPYFDYKNFKYQYPKELETGFNLRKNLLKPEVKQKSSFQLTDEDAPDGTVSVKILKKDKEWEGKKIVVTKKYYTLEDGTQHIVEVEEF
jgi:uncharacterized protein YkwD